MSRYTYSADKTVRAIPLEAYDDSWGIDVKGKVEFYFYDICQLTATGYCTDDIHAPTLRGLLDKIAGEG